MFAKVIVNDNLKHIQRIEIEPIFDDVECVEIEIAALDRYKEKEK